MAVIDYEMITLFHPQLDEDGTTELTEWVQSYIVDLGGEVTEVKPWGRRVLAYPIQKQREASYVQFDFRVDGAKLVDLTRALRLNENVMRQLIVRQGS